MKQFEWTSRDGDVLSTTNLGNDGFLVSELKGFSEPPEFNQIMQQAPYQHGSTNTRAFARPRAIRFNLLMVGPSLVNTEALRRYVGRLFSGLSSQELPNEGTLRVTGENDVVYVISAVPTGCDFATGAASRGGYHQKANIYLTACDPWWRVEPINTEVIEADVAFSVNNTGDVPVWPVWTMNGPLNNPKLTHTNTGYFLEFDGVVDAGWRLEVGHRFGMKYAQIVEVADETNIVNWMPLLTKQSIWWKLAVGNNDLLFTTSLS